MSIIFFHHLICYNHQKTTTSPHIVTIPGLTKAPTGTIGYDATKDGMKYQIKSRKATKWRIPTNFPITEEQLKIADFVIYVEFDNDWNIAKLLKILSEEVTPNKYGRVPISKELVRRYSILEEIAI